MGQYHAEYICRFQQMCVPDAVSGADLDDGTDGRKHDRPIVLFTTPAGPGRSGRVRNQCRIYEVSIGIQGIYPDPWRRPFALARADTVALESTRFNSAG